MKRLLLSACFVALLLSLSGCGSANSQSPSVPTISQSSEALTVPPALSEDNIRVEIKDLQSNLNQWHRFSVDVSHNTDKYLTAEILGSVYDSDGTLLGEKTVFVNNLGPVPTDWISEPFLAKGAPEYQVQYEIISYQFTEGFPDLPEITADNVKDYLRLTTEDFGDVVGSEKEISVSVHNLTPMYCSAKISFVVMDDQGTELLKDAKTFENIRPYTDAEKLLFFPIADKYVVEYAIDDYQFSDTPIS